MPCSFPTFDWPIPWVELDQSAAQAFGCGAKYYVPAGGWEIGARPPTITLTLNASVAAPTQEFSIYDTNGVKIGTSPVGVPLGISTKVINVAYGAFDIDYMYANFVSGTSPLLITAVEGPAFPVFWRNFLGQYETA